MDHLSLLIFKKYQLCSHFLKKWLSSLLKRPPLCFSVGITKYFKCCGLKQKLFYLTSWFGGSQIGQDWVGWFSCPHSPSEGCSAVWRVQGVFSNLAGQLEGRDPLGLWSEHLQLTVPAWRAQWRRAFWKLVSHGSGENSGILMTQPWKSRSPAPASPIVSSSNNSLQFK